MQHLTDGAHYLFRGLILIHHPGIRLYALIPLLVNIAFFLGLWLLGMEWLENAQDTLAAYLPAWIIWLLFPLYFLAFWVVVIFTFVLGLNVFAAPFNGLLAEAVERHLTGKPPQPFRWRCLLANISYSLRFEWQRLSYFLPRALGLSLLSLVPGINLGVPLLWIVLGIWMLGLGYLSYPMGNHGMDFAAHLSSIRSQRWLSLGFGAAIMGALFIPVINLLIVPSAVAGATTLWVERFKAT